MRDLGGGRTAADGFCWVDVLLAMALATLMAALAVPLTARSLDALRARDASAFVATRVRLARQKAVGSAAGAALVFDRSPDGWAIRVCRDRNGNGVRRADIEAGRDDCPDGPWRVAEMFPGMVFGRDARVPGFDAEPGTADALSLGRADMISCSAGGGCTTGTVFLQSSGGEQYAVRIGGVAGRTRIMRFDRGAWRWLAA